MEDLKREGRSAEADVVRKLYSKQESLHQSKSLRVVASKPKLPLEVTDTKTFKKVRNQLKSKGTVPDYSDAAKLLELLGYRHERTKGSHEQWVKENMTFTVVKEGKQVSMSTVVHLRELLRQYADF